MYTQKNSSMRPGGSASPTCSMVWLVQPRTQTQQGIQIGTNAVINQRIHHTVCARTAQPESAPSQKPLHKSAQESRGHQHPFILQNQRLHTPKLSNHKTQPKAPVPQHQKPVPCSRSTDVCCYCDFIAATAASLFFTAPSSSFTILLNHQAFSVFITTVHTL